jgi:hypothetical protein
MLIKFLLKKNREKISKITLKLHPGTHPEAIDLQKKQKMNVSQYLLNKIIKKYIYIYLKLLKLTLK